MRVAVALVVFATFAFMLYGWGWAARRLLRAKPTTWPATAASGMAALVFLGGLLNLAGIAYPWALGCVAGAGIGLGAVAIAKGERPRISVAPLTVAVVVLVFVAITQVPPRAYNFHDDYQKYFVHPVRMLETGTVFGSPLNDIGLDTLGGQAFLDGFAVRFFPIQYINGVGAAFAFFLCMLLASEFGGILPMLAVVFINPQYVNISALFTGSLLIMAVIEDLGTSAAVTGLLYAGLVALKSTFVLFVAVHVAAALWARGIKWTARAAAFGALFLAPWILLHAPHYEEMFRAGGPNIVDTGVRPNESFSIFSPGALDYGSTPLNYTGLMIVVTLCGIMLARSKGKRDMTAAACFAMVAAYLIMMYVSGPRNAGYAQAIRYFAPFAIGIAPVMFLEIKGARWLPLVALIPVLAFAPSLRARMEQAIHSGSVLAFSWLAPDPEYLEYNRQVLYGDMRRRVAAAQDKVPPGETVVVWINAPFYLDFARNRVADVEPGAGLIAPWSRMPDARYFIFEYGGYANMDDADYVDAAAEGPDFMRRVSTARLAMTRRLRDLMQRGEKLYDDGSIAVFRLATSRLPASATLSAADAPLFRAEIARIEGLLASAPDKAAVTYQMARTWASAKQWPEALDWLRKAVEFKAGFDPSRDSVFADLRGTPEFEDILSTAREATPAISHSSPAFRLEEGDLVPESMAYDPNGKRFYFGSMRKGEVSRCAASGDCAPFANGLGAVLGLKVHGGGLWLLNNSDKESDLIYYDLASQREVRRYGVTGAGHTFNDLAITENGDIYVTDTPAGAVWLLANGSATLTSLPGRFEAANGIALSTEGKLLYVSTFPDGIDVVDLKSRIRAPIGRPANLCLAAIDGLSFHGGGLIAIQNGFMSPRVVRLNLAGDLRAIDRFEVLERRNPLFDGVTNGVVAGDDFFYMANIQDEKTTGFNPITILKLHL